MDLRIRLSMGALALGLSCAQAMDLRQAYEAALAQSPNIEVAREDVKSVEESVDMARAQLKPSLSAGVSRAMNNLQQHSVDVFGQQTSGARRYFSYNKAITLRQRVLNLPSWHKLEQAKYRVDDAHAVLQYRQDGLASDVATAYFAVLLSRDQVEQTQADLRFFEGQLQQAEKTFAAGVGTKTDVDEARARLDMGRVKLLAAQEGLAYNVQSLQAMMDDAVGDLLALDVQAMRHGVQEDHSAQDWVDWAFQRSPEVKALSARVDIARQEAQAIDTGRYPTLDLIAQLSHSGSENVTSVDSSYRNRQIQLQLNVPIYSGGYQSAAERQAAAGVRKALEQLDALKRDLRLRVLKAHKTVLEGLARIQAFETAVASSQSALYSTTKSFEAGLRNRIDILNARSQLAQAQRNLSEARYDYVTAYIQLNVLSGADMPALIDRLNVWLH